MPGKAHLNTPVSPVRQPEGNDTPLRGAQSNEFLQDQLRQLSGGTGGLGAADAGGGGITASTPPGDYVTMDGGSKASYLAQLFHSPQVAQTFNDRGFNATDQSRLAAVMQNEGGLNERRRMLGAHYTQAAHSLMRKLAGARRSVTDLAGADSDPKLKLTEDERAVLAAAQAGQFDLAALDGASADAREAAQKGLLQAGIDHQTALYDQYSTLAERRRSGDALSRTDQARLAELGNRSLYSSGTFDDARGMSSARFAGVYAEGQTRFEPSRYARSRDHIERWESGGEKGEGGGVGAGNESARSWVTRHPEARNGNMDALADAETSWGTTQIMGHYADRGNLHRADGTAFTMDDMRASGARRSPNGTDVDLQIAYFRDVVGVQGHLGSAGEIAVQYNGPGAPQSYTDSLVANGARYDRAIGALGLPPRRRSSALESDDGTVPT